MQDSGGWGGQGRNRGRARDWPKTRSGPQGWADHRKKIHHWRGEWVWWKLNNAEDKCTRLWSKWNWSYNESLPFYVVAFSHNDPRVATPWGSQNLGLQQENIDIIQFSKNEFLKWWGKVFGLLLSTRVRHRPFYVCMQSLIDQSNIS